MTAVLVVDDEALAAQEVAEALESAGFDARWCGDPLLALELAADPAIVAIVTDLRMPRIDGIQLIARIRADRPGVKFIVLTGHVAGGAHDAIESPDVFAQLSKPVDIAALVDATRAAIRGTSR